MVWHGRHSGLGLGGKLEMGLQSTNARSALLLAVQTQLPSSCAGTGGERLPPRRSSSGSQARAAKGKEAKRPELSAREFVRLASEVAPACSEGLAPRRRGREQRPRPVLAPSMPPNSQERCRRRLCSTQCRASHLRC